MKLKTAPIWRGEGGQAAGIAGLRRLQQLEWIQMKTVGIIVLALGILAMVYGGFSYTKDTTAMKVGPIELSVKEKEQVNVPMWVGVAAAVAGGLMLALGGRK